MSAIFEGYEKELQELSSTIARKAALIPTLTRGVCPHWAQCCAQPFRKLSA
jgi:hypothetical protein